MDEPGEHRLPAAGAPPQRADQGWRPGGAEILVALVVGLFLLQRPIVDALDWPAFQTWSTVFVSIVVQATPFLVLGVVLSAVIAAFVPPSFFMRVLPRSPALAVPTAGAAGLVLPGCECASVPVAGSLVRRGVVPAAALAFLLSAPAINPIVLVSTAVAFPGQPEVVVARFVASLATAVVVGWVWLRVGRGEWFRTPRSFAAPGASRAETFRQTAQHDLLHAGGFLVLGAMVAAALNVWVPVEVIDAVADRPWLAVLALALLAVAVSICSEADAFVAASLTAFPMTARLAFMVVGPAVDLKLVAMQAGTFGRSFALRFAPLTFVVAVAASVLVGGWLL